MAKKTRLEILSEMKTIGYWSAIGGVEVKEIKDEGYETYVYCISNAWGGKKQAHRVKVNTTVGGSSYVVIHGYRLNMNECLRT